MPTPGDLPLRMRMKSRSHRTGSASWCCIRHPPLKRIWNCIIAAPRNNGSWPASVHSRGSPHYSRSLFRFESDLADDHSEFPRIDVTGRKRFVQHEVDSDRVELKRC